MVNIYGTLGPACASEKVLAEMFSLGMTGMRLNLSHVTLAESGDLIGKMKRAAEKCGVKPQLLVDLQGPELRTGTISEPVSLKNGDIVEIITSQNSKGPNRDWLAIVKTAQARTKIKQWFKKEEKEENIIRGREMILADIKKKGYQPQDLLRPEWEEIVLVKYDFKTWDALLAAVGYGGMKEGQVVNRLKDEYLKEKRKTQTAEDALKDFEKTIDQKPVKKHKSKSGVVVEGIGDVAVRFSKCCSPVPGDEIIGFVTRGRGVTIHRTDCINVINLSNEERGRLINAEWDTQFAKGESNTSYLAELKVVANDRVGLIVEISRQLADDDISVKGFNVRTTKDMQAILNVTIEIKTKEQLERVVTRLKNLRDVTEVERVSGLG